jgi:hypothetical protein
VDSKISYFEIKCPTQSKWLEIFKLPSFSLQSLNAILKQKVGEKAEKSRKSSVERIVFSWSFGEKNRLIVYRKDKTIPMVLTCAEVHCFVAQNTVCRGWRTGFQDDTTCDLGYLNCRHHWRAVYRATMITSSSLLGVIVRGIHYGTI